VGIVFRVQTPLSELLGGPELIYNPRPMGIRVALLIVATLALLTSLVFNILQYEWRRKERARHERERSEAKAEQRENLRLVPLFYNANGASSPIRITGSQHLMEGLSVDLWGGITVVNPTQSHMKITPTRLLVDDVDWEFQSVTFHSRGNARDRSERISLMGNGKQGYDLHFVFPKDKCPKGLSGELCLTSSNREDEPFSIPISFS